MGIIRLHLMRFTELKTRGPQRENSGDFGDSGLLSATFCDLRCNGQKTKKSSNTAKILGFEGVKLVSAEGIEPSTY
jgi:hypothetical protein